MLFVELGPEFELSRHSKGKFFSSIHFCNILYDDINSDVSHVRFLVLSGPGSISGLGRLALTF